MIAAVKDDTLGNMFNILSISSFGAPFEVWTSKTCLEKKKTPKWIHTGFSVDILQRWSVVELVQGYKYQ